MSSNDQFERKRFRRVLILLLYAHYEGFCRTALCIYVNYINQRTLSCADASPAVVAGAWTDIFRALDNADQKCSVFKNKLPHDAPLHRFARRRDFAEELGGFLARTVSIPDNVIDTESNLWPIVLRKNLFRLGLDHEKFCDHDADITHLLQRRNNISHGADRDGMDEQDYNRLQSSVLTVMEQMLDFVMESSQQEAFRRAAVAGIAIASPEEIASDLDAAI